MTTPIEDYEGVAPEPAPQVPRARFSGVVARLTAVNFLVMALGVVTGPLTARALGPSGRGALAAIVVPFTLAPLILSFGLPSYANRQAARDRDLGALLGVLALLCLAISAIGAALAFPLSALLAQGRHVVHVYLLAGLLLVPLGLLNVVLFGVANGLQRWNTLVFSRLTAPLLGLVATVVLYVLGLLTVASAALLTLISVTISIAPLLPVLRDCGRPRLNWRLVREASSFGGRAWLGQVSSIALDRLDQLLMITLVSERQLGLYAVAVTLASLPSTLSAAIVSALTPRIAQGEHWMAARTVRVAMALTALGAIALAVVAPWFLPLLFGRGFRDAVPIAWILFVASVPGQAAWVLGAALTSAGRPGTSTIGALGGVVASVVGLLLLLGPLAGIGAALVTLVANGVVFTLYVVAWRRHFGGRVREFVLIRPEDVASAASLARTQLRPLVRLAGRSAPA